MIRALLLLLFAVTAYGDDAARRSGFSPTGRAEARPTFDIPDVEVTTHEGKKVRFYSDLVKGRTVAVNFIYTNCSTICPSSGALFSALQKEHGRVQFISISIEPKVDTPAKLAEWSRRFRTTPRWTLVTGTPEAIETLVKSFGQTTARPQDHTPLTIVGSDVTHTWSKLYGFPGPEKIAKLVSEVSQ